MRELSDHSYAKFFGNTLLEEIFRLDNELTQAVINSKDPVIEDELEREMSEAVGLYEAIDPRTDHTVLSAMGWRRGQWSYFYNIQDTPSIENMESGNMKVYKDNHQK